MTNAAQMKVVQTHMDKSDWVKAESCCRALLENTPNHAEGLKKLGMALYFQHKWPAAIEVLKRCEAQRPDDAETLHWLLASSRENYDTENMYDTALRLRGRPWIPDDELAVYEAFEDACAWHDAAMVQERALALPREGKITADQLPYLMVLLNHVPNIAPSLIYDIHRVWGDSIMQRTGGTRLAETMPPPLPRARLKIAYASADFREHPIGKFMRTIFASHNHHLFEIYCYSHMLADDKITDEIRLASDHFIEVTDLDPEALARRIHKDGIHILIEIGAHMAHSKLASLAWKPAPVQITYLAQPNTTGMPTVDFRITDHNSEAPGGTRYVEKQLYMPESFLCMGHLPEFERIATTPAERNGYITFCSFNGVRKFNPEVIAVWSTILKRVKKSKLVIKSPGSSVPIVRSNILKEFKRNGIRDDRLEFVEFCTFKEHADWHNKVDIALDSFPYNGTTTTFDTLWMGVPVVTLVGALHAQRTSYTILKNIGFDEAAAAFTPEEYVNKAVHLAKHPETLSFLRRCLPDMIRHSILFQPERFTSQLETLYIRAWEEKMGAWQRTCLENANQEVRVTHSEIEPSVRKEVPGRIFIAGMPRSGSVWLHRAITTMIKQYKEKTLPKIQFFHAPTGKALEVIQSDDAAVFYTRRDLRDVVIALMDIHGSSFEEIVEGEHLQHLIADDNTWAELPQAYITSYEDIVNIPEQVIQLIGSCLGYKISDAKAKSIAKSCRKISDNADLNSLSQKTDNPEETRIKDEPSKQGSEADEFADDPPGIHINKLSPEQIGGLNIEMHHWLEGCNYIAPSYPAMGASKAMYIQTQGNFKICMPASLTQRSTYILLEQEDWCEPDIRFLRQWMVPGMHCADIGAGFGCFTLTMGKQVGSNGKVWVFEPSNMASFLHHSIELNGLDHCHLTRIAASSHKDCRVDISFEGDGEVSIVTDSDDLTKETVATTIDDLAEQHAWQELDFVRINAGCQAGDVLQGGQTFLKDHSPLLMVTCVSENTGIIEQLSGWGYAPYRLIPGLDFLMSFDSGNATEEMPLNLFFCKKSCAKKLRQGGYLIDSESLKQTIQMPKKDIWQQFSCQFPYVERLAFAWNNEGASSVPDSKAYKQLLNMYATAWERKIPVQKRVVWLQDAYTRLSALLNTYTNLPRLLTLARIAIDLNETDIACQALDSIINHLSEGNLFTQEEPFLAVSLWAETIDPGDHPAEWCLAQAIHARVQHSALSSWVTKTDDIHLLNMFQQCGFPNAEMERRRQLLLMRCGQQVEPEPQSLLVQKTKDNLNPSFWQNNPSLKPNPVWKNVCSSSLGDESATGTQQEDMGQDISPESLTVNEMLAELPSKCLDGPKESRGLMICDRLSPEMWRMLHAYYTSDDNTLPGWMIVAVPHIDMQEKICGYLGYLNQNEETPERQLCILHIPEHDEQTFFSALLTQCSQLHLLQHEDTSLQDIAMDIAKDMNVSLIQHHEESAYIPDSLPLLTNDKVTVLMPTWNRLYSLKRAVTDILGQTYKNFDLIISDNASTDGTQEYCLELERSDKRVHYHRNDKNIGAVNNMVQLFEMVETDLYVTCSDDDLLYPNHLSDAIQAFRKNPDAGMVFGQCDIGNQSMSEISRGGLPGNYTHDCVVGPQQVLLDSISGNHICWTSCMIRKSAVSGMAKYAFAHLGTKSDDVIDFLKLLIGDGGDYLFNLIMVVCAPVIHTRRPTGCYTVHAEAASSQQLGGGWGLELRLKVTSYIHKIYGQHYGKDSSEKRRLVTIVQQLRQQMQSTELSLSADDCTTHKKKLAEFANILSELEYISGIRETQ